MAAGGAGQKSSRFLLAGGMDLITPGLTINPGAARAALNYESSLNGYQRFIGFERFDGRPAPHSAAFWELAFVFGSAAIAAGNTVTGQTSGATGVALADGTVTSGSYGGSNATGYLGLSAVTGTFIDGENLRVGGVTKAIASGTAGQGVSPDDATAKLWQATAIANARALIGVVPGSGPVRGVWFYGGSFYAFRDNVGATAGVMFKSSAAGWVPVTMSRRLNFTSGGTTEILEGMVITGATSAATGTVKRLTVTSGTWAGGDAAGYIILDSQTGNFVAENISIPAHADAATIAANSAVITLPPGGRYQFITKNFFGTANLRRMYGVNGVGLAFEFDGTTFNPISGLPGNPSADKPRAIAEHNKALALGYEVGALELSVVGDPTVFSATLGAIDIGVGDKLYDLIPTRGALIVLCDTSVQVLYGNDSTDYQLSTLTDEAGALPYTAQVIGTPVYMDNRGVRSLNATQEFGNFNIGTLSQAIRPLIQNKIDAGVLPVASIRARSKDRYRLFFSDNSGISVFMGKKRPECMMLDLSIPVTCSCSVEDDAHEERVMFGSDNGFVYEMDKGVDFDGDGFFRYIRLPFNHCGAPDYLKQVHRVVFGCNAAPGTVITVKAEFDGGDPESAGTDAIITELTGGGGQWDLSLWDNFYWDAPYEGKGFAFLEGVGGDVSIVIAGDTAGQPPDLLQHATIYYTLRGFIRA